MEPKKSNACKIEFSSDCPMNESVLPDSHVSYAPHTGRVLQLFLCSVDTCENLHLPHLLPSEKIIV